MQVNSGDDPVILVSNDTHVGPRLVEDLRPYCPAKYLEDYDAYVASIEANPIVDFIANHPNRKTAGHYDQKTRLADYDYDGVAAGVIYHGSQNLQPLPFLPINPGDAPFSGELVAAGQQMYNRWLADFVSEAPLRHVGLAQLPMWDPEAALAEAVRTHDAGLKGVNFPTMREGIAPYVEEVWEDFWSMCEERKIPLVTHVPIGSGAGTKTTFKGKGPEMAMVHAMETGGWMSRRAIWWMIFGGVFQRHPDLKLVITEAPGNWWPYLAAELDSIYDMTATRARLMLPDFYEKDLPRHPSEYMVSNVFFGATFTSPAEAKSAIDDGFYTQLMWGTDYPHLEGTFVNPQGTDMPSVTKLSLRNGFSELPADKVRMMVGLNAIKLYGLDEKALAKIAREIGAPTANDLATPIDFIPEGAANFAFRSGEGWA